MKSIIFIMVCISVVFAVSTHFRVAQYEAWKKLPHENERIAYLSAMTDDAHYWNRLAKEYIKGIDDEPGADHMRFFPDGEGSLRPVPLLSVMLAKGASLLNVSVEWAGIYMSPVLAGLFIIPLFCYFYFLGMPAAGVLGGLLGTFSFYYYIRTSFGYVDTDILNLFFLYTTSLFILMATEDADRKKVILFSALAGLTQFFFYWWYFKPGITVVFLAVYILAMLIAKRDEPKLVLYGVVAFVVCSNPFNLLGGLINLKDLLIKYLTGSSAVGTYFPNALQTISEFQSLGIKKVLGGLLSSQAVALAGLLLFIIFFVRHWRRMIPLAPIILLGMMAFVSSIRFSYYLAAFIGIGYGMSIHFLVSRFLKGRVSEVYHQYLAVGLAAVFFLSVLPLTAYDKMRLPSSSKSKLAKAYEELKSKIPEDSPVYTWWDDGYKIANIADRATFHDGGIQQTAKTYFIARSFVSNSQEELHATIKYLEEKGYAEIKKMTEAGEPPQEIIDDVVNYESRQKSKAYLLFSNDMIAKYPAFNMLGNWDFEKQSGELKGFTFTNCYKLEFGKLHCDAGAFDLNKGYQNESVPIKRFLFIENGHVTKDRTFQNEEGIYLEIMFQDKRFAGALIMNKEIFQSNFNQMFVLGRFDFGKFRQVYNEAPYVRVFKVMY